MYNLVLNLKTRSFMRLRIYLFTKGMTIADFAKSIDFQPRYISAIGRGACKAGKKVARVIEKATNGVVTAQEVLSEYDERRKKDQEKEEIFLLDRNFEGL
jgi:ribosome-binding protein aMBF1 (putative translation factor)